jgi:hypothetical protein
MLALTVRLEGNLVIRWEAPDRFEVRFVPTNPPNVPATRRWLPDAAALERLLSGLGLEQERIVAVLASPYVLHSLRVKLDPRAARRVGLVPTPLRRALDALTQWLRRRP